MPSLFASSELFDLIEKVEMGERLNYDAGVRMMNSQDILALGYMANFVREQKNGNQTFFIVDKRLDTEVQDATMFYGNLESTEERIDQMLQLRAVQDQTGEYLSFRPQSYYPEDRLIEGTMGVETTTGIEDLKTVAISRILLDNFDHIKVSWVMLGPKLTQVSLAFGVDELEGNIVEERISHLEGVDTSPVLTVRAIIHMIEKAGRVAVERDGVGGSTCKQRP
ncbi:FO synthase [Desulfosporosinus fructosivorans]|uniref:FO synthase n=1 Tax=Desulfosporosinus fructosivorans TaxID=2018669 RepID=A0A4Z0R670_9FIRM|nr:FO synthase [Desulfosporosinus fructosivorans]TGE37593.1 FO synthase [Desulfosporosinus fructosivorans]